MDRKLCKLQKVLVRLVESILAHNRQNKRLRWQLQSIVQTIIVQLDPQNAQTPEFCEAGECDFLSLFEMYRFKWNYVIHMINGEDYVWNQMYREHRRIIKSARRLLKGI